VRSKLGISLLAVVVALSLTPADAALSAASIPAAFDELLSARALSNPAMILIDGTTGEVVYERNSYSQRKPASVMKLLAGVATLTYLDPQSTFTTDISLGLEDRTLIIQGSYDPWISLNHNVARKMKRESLPYLAFNAMSAIKKANRGSLKKITVLYSGLYSQDVANFKSFWAKRGFKPKMKAVSGDEALLNAASPIVSDTSPSLDKILDFTIKWSDNALADRLARLSSRAAGNAFNAAQLLFKVRKDEKYKLLYTSLPVGGVSGTLRSRFLTTAPNAIGLVRAKTGTLNGTVTLAGYVESTDREYVFVTLADEIPRGASAEKKARAAIDRLIGRIAAPNIPAVISEVTPAP